MAILMNKKTAPYIIISFLLVVIIIMMMMTRKTDVDCEPCSTFDTTAFIEGLRIDYPVVSYIPKQQIIYKDTGSTHLIPFSIPIDSLAIVKAFFSETMVIDTVKRDSNIYLVITDVISENKIKKRTLSNFSIYPKYKIVTVTEKPKEINKFYLGFGVGGNQYHFGLTANALLVSKRSVAYQVSYDFFNKDIFISLYWKLSFNRFRK